MKPGQYRLMYQEEDHHWWFLAKRKFIYVLLKNKKRNLNILDVGCGTGGTTKYLKQWGKVTGIEPSPQSRQFLKKRKINFKKTTFEKYQTKKKFDLICFLDVLYHKNITDDQKAIKKAFELLKPAGMLLVTDCALPFFYGPHDGEMYGRQRYLLDELKKKITLAGFIIQKSSYIYFFTFPMFAITRLLQKTFQRKNNISFPMIINSLLLYLCSFEARLLSYLNFPIGSSVIILAKKP